ncbi:helix-turn-helix transcriptional regulator [Sphingobium xenophagum]|nr:AraC family transcriptional regulator [Sphingobium xenophagum]
MLSSQIAEMAVESELGANFDAAWTRYGLGPLELNFLSCKPQTVSRSPEMVARDRAPFFELLYARSGLINVSHGRFRSSVPEGAFVILNDQLEYGLDFPEGSNCLTVRMPEPWLTPWIASPHDVIGRPLGVDQPWARPLAGLLTAIADAGLESAALPRAVVADQIGAMCALLAEAGSAEDIGRNDGLTKRIRAAIRERHADTAIDPSIIADELGISRRHLHRVLAGNSTTFGALLNAIRLSRAELLLSDPRNGDMSIGTIAWEVGYEDQGHFARLFKKRRGVTASQFRAALRRNQH